MKTITIIALTLYTIGLAMLAFMFCFGDPGTLGGYLPFGLIVGSIPFSAALTYCLISDDGSAA